MLSTLTLAEKDGKTTITKTILYPSREERDAALQTGMKDGVAASFDRLAEVVASMAGSRESWGYEWKGANRGPRLPAWAGAFWPVGSQSTT
jgi:hypothetical protein